MRVPALALAALLLVPLALAQPDGLVLLLDPSGHDGAGNLLDASPAGNHARLVGFASPADAFVGEGTPDDPRALRFDGVDDQLATTQRTPAPNAATLAVWFRTTTPQGKLAGFENLAEGPRSGAFDRHLYFDNDGMLRWGVWTGSATSIATTTSPGDGAWHQAVGVIEPTPTGRSRITLYLDGEEIGSATDLAPAQYEGYWRVGGGNLGNWGVPPEAYHYRGDVWGVRAYDRALSPIEVLSLAAERPEGSLQRPPVTPTQQPPVSDRLGITVTSATEDGALVLTAVATAAPATARIVFVDEAGASHDAGAADAPARWSPGASGRYRAELRDGETVLASQEIVALAPLATPAEAIVGLAAGATVVAASAAVGAKSFNAISFLRKALFWRYADKLRQRTAAFGALRAGSVTAAILALVVMALLIALGKPGALARGSLLAALVVAGLATLVFKTVQTIAGVLFARLSRGEPSYRFWTAGTLALALTSLVFHTPFGYTGYVDRRRKRAATPANDARAAIAGLGANAALVAVFLAIGLAASVGFAEAGIAIALGAFGAGALPISGLPGHALWRWNKIAGIACGVLGFVPVYLFETGLLPIAGVWAVGILGAAAWLGVTMFEAIRGPDPAPDAIAA